MTNTATEPYYYRDDLPQIDIESFLPALKEGLKARFGVDSLEGYELVCQDSCDNLLTIGRCVLDAAEKRIVILGI